MTSVEYKDIDFVWISDHWDFHRGGVCRHNGALAEFSCVEETPAGWGTCGEDCDGCPCCELLIVCQIKPLTRLQKLRWLFKKRAFETCVGRHWTYPNRRNGERFKSNKPRWLGALLFSLYYRKWASGLIVFYGYRKPQPGAHK